MKIVSQILGLNITNAFFDTIDARRHQATNSLTPILTPGKAAFQPYETTILRSVDRSHPYTTTECEHESNCKVHGEVAERGSASNLGRCRRVQSASDGS